MNVTVLSVELTKHRNIYEVTGAVFFSFLPFDMNKRGVFFGVDFGNGYGPGRVSVPKLFLFCVSVRLRTVGSKILNFRSATVDVPVTSYIFSTAVTSVGKNWKKPEFLRIS